jgi:RHH-type proline utilization regulon transcriptional repressor/proline dehydrogenase/delta 1-pyrroline-5-carboxylate dehydrogenase
MDLRDRAAPETVADLADEATATARRWLDAAADIPTPPAEARLAELVADPDGASFAIGFVDGVLRPQDLRVAGRNLDRLSRALPHGLHWYSELGAQFAGGFAPLLPSPIVPLARDAFLRSVGQLLLRLDGPDLARQLAGLIEPGGIRPILAPITAVASGRREADRQVVDARELLSEPDAAGLSISPSAIVGRPRPIDLERVARHAAEVLTPPAELATARDRSFELDVQRLAELAPALRMLYELGERHPSLRLGLGLPAYLPESLPAAEEVAAWARRRRDAGGAAVTVRVTKGEQLGEERADALRRGWVPAPFATRTETDAQFLRMLDRLLRPGLAGAVRVVAATHNLFEAAWAWRLARRRNVEGGLEHEFVLGLASAQAAAARRDLGGIRLFVPVVQPGQLPLAAPYLVRRLQDLAGPESHLSAAARIAGDAAVFSREEEHFRASLAAASAEAADAAPPARRRHDPLRTASADFTLEAAREWASGVFARARDSVAGEALLARTRLAGTAELFALVDRTAGAGREWGQRRGSTRATVLESVAEVLAEWRGLLAEVAVSESGVTIVEADAEVTTAIGLAGRAAHHARGLDGVSGVVHRPPALTVVVSPRSGPIARPAGAVLAALAAGGAVILKTAPETRRSSAVLLETLIAGGVPEELLGLVDDEGELARELLCHPSVDRVLLDGSRHTAKLFHSWRAELPLFARTGGRNAIVVTPSADLEDAAADVVASAFDHAGQDASATDTVILVGSVGESSRFLGRLRDAVASHPAGRPGTPAAGIARLARPAAGRVLEALEVLGPGESWLVRPQRLDEEGRLWSPGLRDGVQPGSAFRNSENRAPVLGLMRAATLTEAIELQNAPGFGLAAGIQSLDADELAEWLETVEAGLLFANRPVETGGSVVLPYGGWNRSNVGAGTAAGGPSELIALGRWAPAPAEPGTTVSLEGIADPVRRVVEAALPAMDFEGFGRVRAGALSDAEAWRELGRPRELAGLELERNVLRHRPVPVTIRVAADAPASDLVRVLAAATIVGAPVAISTAVPLHAQLIELFGMPDSPVAVVEVLVESEVRWHARIQAGGLATTRIRLLGGDGQVLARVLHGQPRVTVHAGPVTIAGRVELLPFLREQSIRMSAERFGRPVPEVLGLSLE